MWPTEGVTFSVTSSVAPLTRVLLFFEGQIVDLEQAPFEWSTRHDGIVSVAETFVAPAGALFAMKSVIVTRLPARAGAGEALCEIERSADVAGLTVEFR